MITFYNIINNCTFNIYMKVIKKAKKKINHFKFFFC